MFKRCLSILLIVALTAASFQQYVIYAGFELNRDYIAKNLCINRARPWMHCNGKCYFMRKMKQAAENERKQQAKDNLSQVQVSFFEQTGIVSFLSTLVTQPRADLPVYRASYSFSFTSSLLQPPRPICA
jgi:hypothetical protein